MKRVMLSAAILLALTLVSFWSLHLLREECSRFEQYAAETAEAYAAGDIDAALAAYDAMDAQWPRFAHISGLFISAEKLDPIGAVLGGLRPLISQGTPEAAADLERLRRMIRDISEEEKPEIWHLF